MRGGRWLLLSSAVEILSCRSWPEKYSLNPRFHTDDLPTDCDLVRPLRPRKMSSIVIHRLPPFFNSRPLGKYSLKLIFNSSPLLTYSFTAVLSEKCLALQLDRSWLYKSNLTSAPELSCESLNHSPIHFDFSLFHPPTLFTPSHALPSSQYKAATQNLQSEEIKSCIWRPAILSDTILCGGYGP